MIVRRFWPALLALSLGLGIFAQQAQYAASLLSGLVWRDVGPMRGGRTYGVAGNAESAGYVLLRLGRRRRVEDGELRPDVGADLR